MAAAAGVAVRTIKTAAAVVVVAPEATATVRSGRMPATFQLGVVVLGPPEAEVVQGAIPTTRAVRGVLESTDSAVVVVAVVGQ